MTIMAPPELTCGPTRLPCKPGMTWIERVCATGWDVDQLTGCWEWRGVRLPNGRARLAKSGARTFPYRVTYEAVYGPIGEGLMACHKCDNPGCINPDHIIPGTQMDNIRMMTPDRRPDSVSEGVRDAIRFLYATNRITQFQLARAYEISQKTVSRIVRLETLKDGSPS